MKKLIKGFLDKYYKKKFEIPDPEFSLQLLKQQGFIPKTIFDVGAYNGDFAKMARGIWSDADIVCFEGLPEKVAKLKTNLHDTKIKVIEGLVGERNDDKVKFFKVESATSVLEEQTPNDFEVGYQTMRTLDSCIEQFSLHKPQLLKIDTQGYEYNILTGFENNLHYVDVILAELNFIDIHKNVKLAFDVIELLNNNGFVIFDICQLHRRPSDKALWQADFIFVKKDSVLRKNKSW
ncbi:MAG: FkbM family methyltransferase [Segetibacter sp.]|nr:FkbM family methyltransferase [Segetibacter sp.]